MRYPTNSHPFARFDAEALVVAFASSPSTRTSNTSSLLAFDVRTGAVVRSFDGPPFVSGGTQRRSALCVCPFACRLLALRPERNCLDCYPLGFKKTKTQKIAFCETPSAVAAFESVVAVGFESGAIGLWECTSGARLAVVVSGHFKRITSMVFTSDGSSVACGSEDCCVTQWGIAEMSCGTTNEEDGTNDVNPAKRWTSHQLVVLDVCASKAAGAGADVVLTCSADRTVRVFTTTSALGDECLRTFEMPKPITAVMLDGEDRSAFAGSDQGEVYEMNLNGAPMIANANDGGIGGANENENEEEEKKKTKEKSNESNANENFRTYRGHNGAVASLHCTRDGSTLISSSEDGTIRFWDRASGVCKKIARHPNGGHVTIVTAILALREDIEPPPPPSAPTSDVNLLLHAQNRQKSDPQDYTKLPFASFELYSGTSRDNGSGKCAPWDGPFVTM